MGVVKDSRRIRKGFPSSRVRARPHPDPNPSPYITSNNPNAVVGPSTQARMRSINAFGRVRAVRQRSLTAKGDQWI